MVQTWCHVRGAFFTRSFKEGRRRQCKDPKESQTKEVKNKLEIHFGLFFFFIILLTRKWLVQIRTLTEEQRNERDPVHRYRVPVTRKSRDPGTGTRKEINQTNQRGRTITWRHYREEMALFKRKTGTPL